MHLMNLLKYATIFTQRLDKTRCKFQEVNLVLIIKGRPDIVASGFKEAEIQDALM